MTTCAISTQRARAGVAKLGEAHLVGKTQHLARLCFPPSVPSPAEREENSTFPPRQMVAFFDSFFKKSLCLKFLTDEAGISP